MKVIWLRNGLDIQVWTRLYYDFINKLCIGIWPSLKMVWVDKLYDANQYLRIINFRNRRLFLTLYCAIDHSVMFVILHKGALVLDIELRSLRTVLMRSLSQQTETWTTYRQFHYMILTFSNYLQSACTCLRSIEDSWNLSTLCDGLAVPYIGNKDRVSGLHMFSVTSFINIISCVYI